MYRQLREKTGMMVVGERPPHFTQYTGPDGLNDGIETTARCVCTVDLQYMESSERHYRTVIGVQQQVRTVIVMAVKKKKTSISYIEFCYDNIFYIYFDSTLSKFYLPLLYMC